MAEVNNFVRMPVLTDSIKHWILYVSLVFPGRVIVLQNGCQRLGKTKKAHFQESGQGLELRTSLTLL